MAAPDPFGAPLARKVTDGRRLRIMNDGNVVLGLQKFGALFVHLQVCILLRLLQVVVAALQGIMKSFSHREEFRLTVNKTPFGGYS